MTDRPNIEALAQEVKEAAKSWANASFKSGVIAGQEGDDWISDESDNGRHLFERAVSVLAAQAVAVPEGFALVSTEITAEMIEAWTDRPNIEALAEKAKLLAEEWARKAGCQYSWSERYTAKADTLAAIDALAAVQAVAVPQGWKLVPMRPTKAMIEAALYTIQNRKIYGANRHTVAEMIAEEWIGMLSAAPPPPAPVEPIPLSEINWRTEAAAWLRRKADEQEAINQAHPRHAAGYPSWGWRVWDRRSLADDLDAEDGASPFGLDCADPRFETASPAPVGKTLHELDEDDAADSYEIDGMGD